ncbi:MAG: histidine kinase [Burkholderiales bacterium]
MMPRASTPAGPPAGLARLPGAWMTPQWMSWSSLWRGGLLALAVVFVLSTQLLFQFGLYESWSLADILAGWLQYFIEQLLVGGCIFALIAGTTFVPTRSRVGKHALLLMAIALGALGGELLLMLRQQPSLDASAVAILGSRVARWLVVAGLAYLYFVLRRQAAQAAAQVHESELQRVELDRRMTEARLQALRSQIEPHFLFNTLANVQELYRTDPGRGRRMLASFVAYLRTALPRMRHDETTLAHEVDLARTYLDVLQVRMGERLKVRFDIPRELSGLAFPPLALSTLTENAIKHGLNPLPEGGAIDIQARREGRQLKVGVTDTGAGLRASGGPGGGIANLRARLTALYGGEASLALEANAPRGIRATITVPIRAGSGGQA